MNVPFKIMPYFGLREQKGHTNLFLIKRESENICDFFRFLGRLVLFSSTL